MIDVAHVKARALRLSGLASELLAIARQLDPDDGGTPVLSLATRAGGDEVGDSAEGALIAELARQHYRNRRRREKIFGSEALFGEPAWDILVDLFIAAREGRKVSVMSACIGAAVPSTTALRWIAALEREGLLHREDDTHDNRRTYVSLSPKGLSLMADYFDLEARNRRAAPPSIEGSAAASVTHPYAQRRAS